MKMTHATKKDDRPRTRLGRIIAETLIPRTHAWPAMKRRVVNDIHSRLNRTRVSSVLKPDSLEVLQSIIRRARAARQAVCLAGGRHAMGGQQFGTDALL